MHPVYRRSVEGALRKRVSYIELFELIVDHKIVYTIKKKGVFFNMSTLPDEVVRQNDNILRRCEQSMQGS